MVNPDSIQSGSGQSSASQALEVPDILGHVTYLEDLRTEDVELSEVGMSFPIGLSIDGERLDEFTLKPYTTRFDRILGNLLKTNRNNLIKVISAFLPQVIETIGGYSLDQIAEKMSISSSTVIERMPLGDVFMILLAIRLYHQKEGDKIAMDVQCPNCGTHNKDTEATGYHSLSTVMVKRLINPPQSKLSIGVRLADGIRVGSDCIKTVVMEPLKLHQIEKIAKNRNTSEDILTLYQMITGLPESEYYSKVKGNPFSDELYDQLTRGDLDILQGTIKKMQYGPSMEVEMTCQACGYEWEAGIPWGRIREFLYLSSLSD